ncbi:MAG: hypothetical protein KGI54_14780 [Pseudomonadota bacterium]|nr:hypothetical protein [Pseudomonadota bacterium]
MEFPFRTFLRDGTPAVILDFNPALERPYIGYVYGKNSGQYHMQPVTWRKDGTYIDETKPRSLDVEIPSGG